MKKIYLIFILVSIFYCNTDSTIKPEKAYKLLYASMAYKKSECNSEPPFPLFMPSEPIEYAVNACAYSIIKSPCPFDNYPIVCLEIYKKQIRGAKDSTKDDIIKF